MAYLSHKNNTVFSIWYNNVLLITSIIGLPEDIFYSQMKKVMKSLKNNDAA